MIKILEDTGNAKKRQQESVSGAVHQQSVQRKMVTLNPFTCGMTCAAKISGSFTTKLSPSSVLNQ